MRTASARGSRPRRDLGNVTSSCASGPEPFSHASVEETSKVRARPTQARRRGAERNLEELGDLGQRHAFAFLKEEHLAQLVVERIEKLVEHLARALLIHELFSAGGGDIDNGVALVGHRCLL